MAHNIFIIAICCFHVLHSDGADFISEVHTVTFDTTGTQEAMSTEESISILDDKIQEHTESFFCVILRPHGRDGIIAEDPNTVYFTILDDDSMYMQLDLH